MLPIYVDFDDVLSETTLAFLKILKREYEKIERYKGWEQIGLLIKKKIFYSCGR